ncbi:hypothetical protein RIEGSTA812A_PEG_245 [invertebrate metagenome]|uniref:Uncharacterized protein n=1 Tax=invertebrate metagenome TaxID=1711999 RepID=A0A484HAH7_9ZZZZ
MRRTILQLHCLLRSRILSRLLQALDGRRIYRVLALVLDL